MFVDNLPINLIENIKSIHVRFKRAIDIYFICLMICIFHTNCNHIGLCFRKVILKCLAH